MKLISMTEFVLENSVPSPSPYSGRVENEYKVESHDLILAYAKFLRQTLTLGMFVPCDEKGKMIKKQPYFTFANPEYKEKPEYVKYWQAKEKLLFVRPPKLTEDTFMQIIEKYNNIEGLCNNGWDLEIAPHYLKQIGL